MHLWEKRTRYKGLGKAVLERTTNFVWPAAGARFVCLFFIFVFPFAPHLLHSLHDLPNRQSINIERLGNMGFTTISLSSNVKILWACDNFYTIICYNDIKYRITFCNIQSFRNTLNT